jgi:hypothetical protein
VVVSPGSVVAMFAGIAIGMLSHFLNSFDAASWRGAC